jgi:sugar lactone lactonase YvrE
MGTGSRFLRAVAAAAIIVATAADAAQFGEVSVFAQIPINERFPDGFPEGIAVSGDKVFVAGPATLGTSLNNHASKVFEYDRDTGALLRTLPTEGETVLGAEHANACLTLDGDGRLYVVNTQIGVYRLTLPEADQSAYAPPVADLPACLLGLSPKPCSPTPLNLPPLANDIAFDDAGHAYLTDSMQATIWRIPAGGGTPQVWFQDRRLASAYIGVNGVRVSPDRSKLFITVTLDLLGQGYVYTLPLVDKPKAADLKVFHHYPIGSPDGIAFGASGRLYVTLALPGRSGISILNSDGSEYARLGNPLLSPIGPYDSPANIAFDGLGNILVTNHAFTTGIVLPQQFQVLRVFVDDVAAPLPAPVLP